MKYNDKIYYSDKMYSSDKTDMKILVTTGKITGIAKVDSSELPNDHNLYNIDYIDNKGVARFLWVGEIGSGVEIEGARIIVKEINEFDMGKLKTYLYNREMSEVLEVL